MKLFISFEGGEGTGKTTQAELLRDRLVAMGLRCILVHEPGSTPLGRRLRGVIKGELPVTYGAELFLFSAARAELVSKVIRPSLESGTIVLTDRYVDSTTAYQGYGRRLELKHVEAVNSLATQHLLPDLTILLDMCPKDALERLGSLQLRLALEDAATASRGNTLGGDVLNGRIDKEGQRKFEEESLDFHRRVRQGYLEMAREEPGRWFLVDATQSVEAVSEVIRARVESLISENISKDQRRGGSRA